MLHARRGDEPCSGARRSVAARAAISISRLDGPRNAAYGRSDMTRIACTIAGAMLGAALAVLLVVTLERLFFPVVLEATHPTSGQWFDVEWNWLRFVVMVCAPIGALVGGAVGARLGREPRVGPVPRDRT